MNEMNKSFQTFISLNLFNDLMEKVISRGGNSKERFSLCPFTERQGFDLKRKECVKSVFVLLGWVIEITFVYVHLPNRPANE